MANWNEFITSPLKASRQMHVSGRDVSRGAQLDTRRRQREVEAQNRTVPTGASYGQTLRPSTVPSDAPRMYAGELEKAPRSDLISNALLAGNLGGLSAAFGALAPLRAALAIGAGSDAVLSAGNGGELPAGLAAAGVLGRRALPAALASGAAYAADAEAGLLSGLMKFLRSGVEPMHVVKPKGGTWLAGAVEDALRGLRREGMNDVNPEVDSLNRFVEGPLTKYVKTRMASPDDEVRKLAEQGVLHVDPAQLHAPIGLHSGVTRQELGQSPAAKRWEFASDSFIAPETAGLFKVTRAHPDNLGFNHLIDELSNALNPNSGLPPHLQLPPEAVKQMSMEKAVRRVADINQFRKAAMEQARLKELETSGMLGTTTREYAENNPMGLRWVEYTRPEKLHEGVTNIAKHGDEYVALGADGQPIAQRLPDGSTGRLATGKTPEDAHLAGQLITEGNIMGHCVGGYCEDVASGRSRIFSLRDAKGEPHVTVEVTPQPRNIGQQDIPGNYIDDAMEQLGIHEPEAQWGREEEIDQLAGDLWRKDNPDSQRIIQIKGKQNRAPNPEYLPFIQDFVKNPPHGQPWGGVGDLQNTGLLRTRDALNDLEQKTLREKGQEFGDYLSDAEIQALQAQFSSNGGKFASGGSVGVPATGWELLTDPTGSPEENKLSWDIFSGHNDPEQLEAVQ